MEFYTITIKNKCFDLPKKMPVPQIGSVIFIEDFSGEVKQVNYHLFDGKLHMITIFCE